MEPPQPRIVARVTPKSAVRTRSRGEAVGRSAPVERLSLASPPRGYRQARASEGRTAREGAGRGGRREACEAAPDPRTHRDRLGRRARRAVPGLDAHG